MPLFKFGDVRPTEDQCLENLFNTRFGNKLCSKCKKESKFYRVKGRPCYECGHCGYQLYPKKDTIMEKSTISIGTWLEVIFLMVSDVNRISAIQMGRYIGEDTRTARRMCRKIREEMAKDNLEQLSGTIEVDETYIGGDLKNKKNHERWKNKKNSHRNKFLVMGILQRGTRLKLRYVKDTSEEILNGQITANVQAGSTIYSDENAVYKKLPDLGYKHDFVTHKKKEYVRGNITTNGIENVWSIMKTDMRNTFVRISTFYVQNYLYEYEFRYNNRNETNLTRFLKLTDSIGFDLSSYFNQDI